MKNLVPTYAFCHCAVDFCCVATVVCIAVPALGADALLTGAAAVVLYDMLAFALQMPIGAALDSRENGVRTALISYALVALGAVVAFLPVTTTIIAGVVLVALGNAFFHCAGGLDVLRSPQGTYAPSGLFICTGAFGVYFGMRAGDTFGSLLIVAILVLMAVSFLLTMRMAEGLGTSTGSLFIKAPELSPTALVAVILLALTVALRSYTGLVMAFPWKGDFPLALALICAVVCGKALGGIICDRIGPERTSIISLGVAAPIFLLSFAYPTAGLLATLLFNFTMPITLVAIAELMPANRGFAFGIASFSLAIGAIPTFIAAQNVNATALAVLSLISLASLLAGLAASRRSRVG